MWGQSPALMEPHVYREGSSWGHFSTITTSAASFLKQHLGERDFRLLGLQQSDVYRALLAEDTRRTVCLALVLVLWARRLPLEASDHGSGQRSACRTAALLR